MAAQPSGVGEHAGSVGTDDLIVVGEKALIDAVPTVEHSRANKGSGRPAVVGQDFGEGEGFRGESEVAVVADSMHEWILSGKKGRVGDEGDRRWRDSREESSTFGRHRVGGCGCHG